MSRYDDNWQERAVALEAQGLDPHSSDDSVLGVPFVYCGSHMNAHATGWCTVSLADKIPLTAQTPAASIQEARDLGFEIYTDPRPCQFCGEMVDLNDMLLIPAGETYASVIEKGIDRRRCADGKHSHLREGRLRR